MYTRRRTHASKQARTLLFPSALSHTEVGRIFSGANVAVIIHDGGGEGEQCSAASPPLSARPRPPPPLPTYSNGGGDEDGG